MELLTVENISKSYRAHQALRNISIKVPEKSIFGLLGPNGAGKTTLIRIITKIINQDSGTINLNGTPMTEELIRRIGYLPEERGLYKKMKVGEQLIYLAQLKGLSKPDAKRNIKTWLEKLDLISWHNKNIEDLSKGMAQKVQFIATVVHKPDLIILDEPFSGFDPVNANLIKDEILTLRDQGATIIFSTHRMESVEELCDHIAMINRSVKILDGPKNEIKEAHKDGTFELTYLGTLDSVAGFEVIEHQQTDHSLKKSIIKDTAGLGSNGLIKEVLKQVEVHSFIERIPSMNEIFINNVKNQNHE